MPCNSLVFLYPGFSEDSATDCNLSGPSYRCPHCSEEFFTKPRFKRHIAVHTGRRPYVCCYCEDSFGDVASERAHQRRFHSSVRQFRCDVCQMGFLTKGTLTKHRLIHTGHRPYHCKLCPQQFARAWNLKVHVRSHTGEQPYRCAVCSKAYSQSSSLQRHAFKHGHYRP